jgi:uncharacterized protein YjbI with pentapeptide repeats
VTLTVVLAVSILFIGITGLALAIPYLATAEPQPRGGLGTALLTGALVSGAFFALQFVNERNQKRISDRQTLHVTIGLQRDLSGADLVGKDLSGFDMAHKIFSGANFMTATMTDASLQGATLDRAILTDAHLNGADLTGATMVRSVLSGADLAGANLFDARLNGAAIGVAPDGKPANLARASLINAQLRGSCLAHADLRRAVLGGADLTNAVLTGADLRGAVLERDGVPAYFQGASLARARLDDGARSFIARHSGPPRQPERPAPAIAPGSAKRDRVVEISDGDTIRLKRLGWVRLIGLDAPPLTEPLGRTAREALLAIFRRDANVSYTLGPQRRERRLGQTGRWRAYVWLPGGRFLNAALVHGGYAERRADNGDDPRYNPALTRAEEGAKDGGRGIWATCRSPNRAVLVVPKR